MSFSGDMLTSFIGGVGDALVKWASKNKENQEPPQPPPSGPPVYLTIVEVATNEFLVANVEIIAEERNGSGKFRFHRPDGRFFDLDLSEGGYRIIRQQGDRKNS